MCVSTQLFHRFFLVLKSVGDHYAGNAICVCVYFLKKKRTRAKSKKKKKFKELTLLEKKVEVLHKNCVLWLHISDPFFY